MVIAGRKPKPDGQAVNRNKPTHEWTEVERTPFRKGPRLPKLRSNGDPWPARTVQKWKAWSTMPHCKLWGPSDWDFALDSIELAAQFHLGDSKLAVELRNRERVLGTTHDYLRDLRIRYVDPAPVQDVPDNVANMDAYRSL